MGIPYADDIMNAVVLTAVLSCLNSGLYTASRMLFVLAARREAPMQLITVNGRGVPVWAILASTVVGFLSVIAAYVSPDTVFLFLLNSSGAVILFVYLMIALSQFVLRRRTPDAELTVKMWFFPTLTILAAVGIVAVLLQMGFTDATRSQLLLSLLSWGVVVVLYAVTRWRGGSCQRRGARREGRHRGAEDRRARQPDDGRRRAARRARTDRGQRPGVVPRRRAGQPRRHRPGRPRGCGVRLGGHRGRRPGAARPDPRGAAGRGLTVEGEIGDYRPLVALDKAVREFGPDHVVISTQPEERSTWLRHGVVADARERYDVPVQHVVVHAPVAT